MVITIKREDFEKSQGFCDSYGCPLANALTREGLQNFNVGGERVYGSAFPISHGAYSNQRRLFEIPVATIWGGPQAKYSSDRIDKFTRLAKHKLFKYLVPSSITFELKEL